MEEMTKDLDAISEGSLSDMGDTEMMDVDERSAPKRHGPEDQLAGQDFPAVKKAKMDTMTDRPDVEPMEDIGYVLLIGGFLALLFIVPF